MWYIGVSCLRLNSFSWYDVDPKQNTKKGNKKAEQLKKNIATIIKPITIKDRRKGVIEKEVLR